MQTVKVNAKSHQVFEFIFRGTKLRNLTGRSTAFMSCQKFKVCLCVVHTLFYNIPIGPMLKKLPIGTGLEGKRNQSFGASASSYCIAFVIDGSCQPIFNVPFQRMPDAEVVQHGDPRVAGTEKRA